ncbi:MAG: sulfide/dihydroorotate dehydrogenase-like FAD/NAD-binding protein [bacterium]|nr:sulfide/dihydroorotate dehydrogenase-like FAD/NAD-binding protein [bacterium]
MYKIIDKKRLSTNVVQMTIEAPLIARSIKPGQFIIIMVYEKGERIPLTVVTSDKKNGLITIVFQEVGKTTKLLGKKEIGEELYAVMGPNGNPFPVRHYGNIVLVAGGVGVAEIVPIAKALKEADNYIITIVGARTKELLFFTDVLASVSDKLCVTTDDGSYGIKGLVTLPLKELLDTTHIDMILAVGPTIMMKAVSDLTKNYNVKTYVSLNPIMIDGTGMCGGCRVTVGGKTKFVCVDGPEFDGHLVDFDELMMRQKTYLEEERLALKLLEEKDA